MTATAAPKPPDPTTAEVEDWEDYKSVYAAWLDKATDEDLLAEMVALPVEGAPFTPSEAWRYHQCELRRRQPPTTAKRTRAKSQEG
ncbi:MAG TPA: hypothetical protein VK942_09250 [Actinomycetes bacterium]|nr:hypothetical protein [Actinomycetes bacterium]